jgi:hypothetical protein
VDGNLSSTFEDFAQDHICNQFCRYFGLLKPIALCKSLSDTASELLSSKQRGKQRLFEDSVAFSNESPTPGQSIGTHNADEGGIVDMSISRTTK